MPPDGGVNMRMLKTDCIDDPRTASQKGVSFQPLKFPGLKWKMQLVNGHMVTFAWFERGRGVVTGLRSADEVYLCNMVVRGMPSYERGNEYRHYNAIEAQDVLDEEARQSALESNASGSMRGKRMHALKDSKPKRQRLTT